MEFNDTREEARLRIRKKRIRNRRRRRIVSLILLGLILGSGIYMMQGEKPSKEAPPAVMIGDIPVIEEILPQGIPGRPGEKKKIKYIVIHETGNQGKGAGAASHASYLKDKATREALSWHYTVDDHEIYHHLPDNEIAFHAGDKLREDGGNRNGIGVELCVNPENDYEKTLKNGALLTAYLLKTYDLKLDAVKKHQDFSGKNCPQRLIESGRWNEFLGLVEEALQAE